MYLGAPFAGSAILRMMSYSNHFNAQKQTRHTKKYNYYKIPCVPAARRLRDIFPFGMRKSRMISHERWYTAVVLVAIW